MIKTNRRTQSVHLAIRLFSLIEIMVVVLIIAIVSGGVAIGAFKMLANAKHKQAGVDIKVLASGVRAYFLDTNQYPDELDDLVTDTGDRKWNGPYLQDTDFIPQDPWGNDFMYTAPGENGRAFEIISYGEDNQSGGEDNSADIHSWKSKDHN